MVNRLRWLGGVLFMRIHRLIRRTMITGVEISFKKARGWQTRIGHQSSKKLAIGMNYASMCRLRDWGPLDYRNQWLETLSDRCCYLDVVVRLAYHDEPIKLYWLRQLFFKVLQCREGWLKGGETKSSKPKV